jgi:hypothetical protein
MSTTFNDWIIQAKITDDLAGDFIEDTQAIILANRRPPPVFYNMEQLRSYLRLRGACHEAIATVPAVWKRYRRWVKHHEVQEKKTIGFTFTDWVKQVRESYKHFSDHLIYDLKRDDTLPVTFNSFDEFRSYLSSQNACHVAMNVAPKV